MEVIPTAHAAGGIRKLVRVLYDNAVEQRAAVHRCLTTAQWLNANPRKEGEPTSRVVSSSGVCHVLPSTPIFTELTLPEELAEASATTTLGPLSGVAVTVSDALDVVGFQTRFGVKSALLHSVPTTESAFIHWVRKHGATFVGKLRCDSPFAWEEGVVLCKDYPAYVAVDCGAAHYAIMTTVLGAPGVSAPLYHDIIGFKPTSNSFDMSHGGGALRGGEAHSSSTPWHHIFACRGSSVGIVAKTMDDVKYLWDVYTGAVQASSVVQSIKDAERRRAEEQRLAEELAQRQSEALTHMDTFGLRSGDHDALLNRMVRNTQGPALALTVGFPSSWMAEYFPDAFPTGSDFEDHLQSLIESASADMRNVKVDIMELPFTTPRDMDEILKAHKTVAEYELVHELNRYVGDRASQRSKAASGPTTLIATKVSLTSTPTGAPASTTSAVLSSGLLEELPQDIVSAVFEGRNHTDEAYAAALRVRDNTVKDIDNLFRDVDLICSPVVGEPYVDGNIRTFAATVPFAFAGNPVVSARVHDTLSLQLVGEMGRDTGLLEDATSFLRFVGKGKPPRWWRKKFLGEA